MDSPLGAIFRGSSFSSEMIASCPILLPGGGLPGNEADDGLLTFFDEFGSLFLGISADLTDHHDPFRLGVLFEHLRQVWTKLVPLTGSPPIPMQLDRPRPARPSCPTAS